MMKTYRDRYRWAAAGVLLCCFTARVPAQAQTPAQAPIALTDEVDKLKAENHVLKSQIADLSQQLAKSNGLLQTAALLEERAQLVEAFRTKLKAGKDDVFDWQTLTFKAPAKKEEPGAK